MWPYPWTHVGTPSHLGHMDRVAATMPSQAHAGAAQEAPDIGQWEGQDVPLVRPSSCNVKGGIPSSRRYLPTYLQPPLDRKQTTRKLANTKQARRARVETGTASKGLVTPWCAAPADDHAHEQNLALPSRNRPTYINKLHRNPTIRPTNRPQQPTSNPWPPGRAQARPSQEV